MQGSAVKGFRIKADCLFREEEEFRNPRGQRRGRVGQGSTRLQRSWEERREGAAAARTRPESGGRGRHRRGARPAGLQPRSRGHDP